MPPDLPSDSNSHNLGTDAFGTGRASERERASEPLLNTPISPTNTPELQIAQRELKNAPQVDLRASLERAPFVPKSSEIHPRKDIGGRRTSLSNRKRQPQKSAGPREPRFFRWVPEKSLGSLLQKYYLIGGTPPEPNGFAGSAHLAIFACAGPARPASGGGGSRPSAMLGGKGGPAIK